jgi:hypothetical protein
MCNGSFILKNNNIFLKWNLEKMGRDKLLQIIKN